MHLQIYCNIKVIYVIFYIKHLRNHVPVAVDDTATVAEDGSVDIPVKDNDSDLDGDNLTVTVSTGPAHGTATVNLDGTVHYVPNSNYNGQDSFTYTINDGHGGIVTATVTITVTPVNDAPVANNDTASTPEDASVKIPVLGNDSDVDGDTISVSSTTSPSHGSVVVNQDGTITYTPNANYNGVDSFQYTITDGNGGTSTATVNITVTPVNDAPTATGDSKTTPEDTPVSGSVTGSDVDGDALTFTRGTAPAHGSVTVNADGTYTYTPDANYHGSDSFTVTVSDGNGGSATVTVFITVNPVNNAPVAVNDTITATKDTKLSGSVAGNDHQTAGDVYSLVSGPKHGTLVFHADGTFTYTPDPNFTGVDSFVYMITDSSGHVSVATVTISVYGSAVKVNAAETQNKTQKTIPMQHTGIPFAGLVLAVLAVFSGLVMPKRKN